MSTRARYSLLLAFGSLHVAAAFRASFPVFSKRAVARYPTVLVEDGNDAVVEGMYDVKTAAESRTDFNQMLVYPFATLTEFAVIASLFKFIDSVLVLPPACVPPLFLFLSLRSRIFSILPAQRPPRGGYDGSATPKEIKRPYALPLDQPSSYPLMAPQAC